MTSRREPRVRKDGLCALRGCDKPLPPLAVLYRDPFHSAVCTRKFYGVVYMMDNERDLKRKPNEAQRKFGEAGNYRRKT